jgi:hypothetical protein
MKPNVAIAIRCLILYELEQARKGTLLIHHLKGDLILPAVEKKEGHNEV